MKQQISIISQGVQGALWSLAPTKTLQFACDIMGRRPHDVPACTVPKLADHRSGCQFSTPEKQTRIISGCNFQDKEADSDHAQSHAVHVCGHMPYIAKMNSHDSQVRQGGSARKFMDSWHVIQVGSARKLMSSWHVIQLGNA